MSMTRFEFSGPGRIIFGAGCLQELEGLVAGLGQKALLVTGRDSERHAVLPAAPRFCISREPTTRDIELGVQIAHQYEAQVIVAIGGGSVIDAGKAIAAMSTQPGPLLKYIEVIGEGWPLERAALPFIAVPTTAGTGAEATRNAVLHSEEHRVKASLRHVSMLPRVALVDPALSLSVPPSVTAASGMDALTQCLEAYVCTRAQPLTDSFCAEGIQRAVLALPRVFENGSDLSARSDMALCALNSGLALANAGLGAVHGLAAPLGGVYQAPHGAVCAALLAPVWALNSKLVSDRKKFAQVDSWLAGDAVQWLQNRTQQLKIPGLAHWGVKPSDFDEIAQKAAAASSMKANPVPLSHDQIVSILRAAL